MMERRGNIPASPRRGGERLDVRGKGEGVRDVSTAKHSAEPPRTLRRRGCLTEYHESLLNNVDLEVGPMWRSSLPSQSAPCPHKYGPQERKASKREQQSKAI